METFIGRPIILVAKKRKNGTPFLGHKKVTPGTLEDEARGYISDWFVDGEGWFCVRGTIHDDEAKEAINEIGLCSCGYKVTKLGSGGEYHAIPYEEEILSFSGEHLAIVDRPRYEGATIRLNSKPPKNASTMKIAFWKKEAKPADAPAAPAKTNEPAPAGAPDKTNAVQDLSADSELEIPTADGKGVEKVTLADLIADRHNGKKMNADMDGDDEIDVGNGKRVKMNDLVNAYTKMCAMDDEDAKKNKKNGKDEVPAAPAAGAKTDEPTRDNAKPAHFRVLLNARNRPGTGQSAADIVAGGSPDSLEDRCARGNAIFGAKFKVTAAPGVN